MNEPTELACLCGHSHALHDQHGCAAFLGAFPRTAHLTTYCACKRGAGLEKPALRLVHDADREEAVAESLR